MGAPGAISRIASHARPSVQSSCNERGLSELSALPGVMTDQLPPRRKPRNDLLRNYYGIGGKPAENAADITDIDGSNFDAAKYQSKLLKGKRLDALVNRDNELVTEIRQLNGDMKTLVYENYSKFISATDTIRKMRSNVEDMEKEMDNLRDHMDQVTTKCSEIDNSFSDRREKIRRLDGVHNLLKKLQFIFELPNRLQQCYASGAYPQAVQYCTRTNHLLEHYQHLSVFRNIEMECKEIMGRVQDKVKEAMVQPEATSQTIIENTALLIQLKEDPTSLSRQYIRLQVEKMKDSKYRPLHYLKDDDSNPEDLVEKMEQVNVEFLSELEIVVKAYQSFFLPTQPTEDGAKIGMSTSNVSRRSLGSTSQKGSISNQEELPSADLSDEEREQAHEQLINSFSPYLEEYFNAVTNMIKIPTEPLDAPRPLSQIRILSSAYSAIIEDSRALCDMLLAGDRMSSIVEDWESGLLDSLMKGAVAGLQERFKILSDKIVANQEEDASVDPGILTTFVIDTEEWLANFVGMDSLQLLSECLQSGASFVVGKAKKDIFLRQIQSSLLVHWRLIVHSIKQHISDIQAKSSVHQTVCLVASRLCLDFAEIWVIKTYAQFSKELYPNPRRSSNPYRQEEDRDMIVPVLQEDVEKSSELYREAGQTCLVSYARNIGYMLTYKVENALRDKSWSLATEASKYPISVSSVWKDIVAELDTIEHIVDIVYPLDHESAERTGSDFSVSRVNKLGSRSPTDLGLAPANQRLGVTSPSMTSLSSFNNEPQLNTGGGHRSFGNDLLSNISKLFQERVEIYGNVEPSSSDICSGLVKVILKAYNEILRDLTLTEYAFWQVQLDTEYLRIVLWKFARNEKMLNTMVEEICGSAYRRCTKPSSLDSAVLDQILRAYEQ